MILEPHLWKPGRTSADIGKFERGAVTQFADGHISVKQYYWSDGACVVSYPGGYSRSKDKIAVKFIQFGLDSVYKYWGDLQSEQLKREREGGLDAALRALKNPA